jgi:2-octaprenyl-6-methoxyphenol hydroxylase
VLDAREAALPAFGYVVDYGGLAFALGRAARSSVPRYLNGARATAVRHEDGLPLVEYTIEGAVHSVASRLVVLADGGDLVFTPMRTRDYRQTAVTARVRTELPHRHTAYERFTAGGPLALLPAADEMALIWTTDPTHAAVLCAVADSEFLAALQREFGDRLGRFGAVRGRATYPLVLRFAARITLPRTVLIGNAAQTLHPVAGQGFNMGLRDAWELAAEIQTCSPETLGDAAMLRRVEQRRRIDRIGGVAFTDTLVRAFSNDFPPLNVARGAALALLDCAPALKRFVVQRMTFGARG